MKLAIVLLSVLALTAIIGTVIPQGQSPNVYLQAYGQFLYTLFSVLDIYDMYHAWWFQGLLLLLTVNLLVCSVERLSRTWKIIFTSKPIFNINRFRKSSNRVEYNSTQSPDELKERYLPILKKRFGYSRIDEIDNGFCILAEKWRWTRMGVYVVHLSIILLLLGGMVGHRYGFSGHVNVREGEAVDHIRLKNNNEVRNLGFKIRCDDFKVSFYTDGTPKEFVSRLTIIENGKPVLKKDIIVNDPLEYKGIRIYLSSYGEVPRSNVRDGQKSKGPAEIIKLNFTSMETGMKYQKQIKMGQEIIIPEKLGKFQIKSYNESAEFRGRKVGKAYIGTLVIENDRHVDVLLPLHFPNFDKMRKGRVIISVADQEAKIFHPSESSKMYYTGLQVAKDPGVWFVYIGFILMLIGCYITFFMSLQRVCVEIQNKGNDTDVFISGISSKNKTRMEQHVRKLAEKLKKS